MAIMAGRVVTDAGAARQAASILLSRPHKNDKLVVARGCSKPGQHSTVTTTNHSHIVRLEC